MDLVFPNNAFSVTNMIFANNVLMVIIYKKIICVTRKIVLIVYNVLKEIFAYNAKEVIYYKKLMRFTKKEIVLLNVLVVIIQKLIDVNNAIQDAFSVWDLHKMNV